MSTNPNAIYLDNNATTALDPRVLEAMMPYLTNRFGNAASKTHAFGWDAEDAVDLARSEIARLIGARPTEIVFTSGATESSNLAIKGVVERYRDRGDQVITFTTEHKATLDSCTQLEHDGKRVKVLPVRKSGLVDLDALAAAIDDRTILVSIMLVNNEIGVIQPMAEIGALCRERGVLLHCDAAQAFGKIPIDVAAMGIHLLSVSAHKIYGPKGVGVLYVRGRDPKVELTEQVNGGGHEGGRRSGTLNVPGIVGLGEAARLARNEMDEEDGRIAALRDRLLEQIRAEIADITVNGDVEHRISGNLNISFQRVESEGLLMAMPDLAVSSGSACNSTTVEPSYVLRAIGVDDDRALGAIRFGIGRFNTEEEIDRAARIVIDAVQAMSGPSGPERPDTKSTTARVS